MGKNFQREGHIKSFCEQEGLATDLSGFPQFIARPYEGRWGSAARHEIDH